MVMKSLVGFGFLTMLALPAAAAVTTVTTEGFEVTDTATIPASPERVYAALGEIGKWWDSDHTYSGDAANLRIDLKAGACLCERLPGGGSVEHMRVVYAAPGKALRLRGALGPLQSEGVDGALTWSLKADAGGTILTQSYVVGGFTRALTL